MSKLKILNMDEIPVTEVEWLWYPYIPYGKITIVHGDPGDGKTMMILQLASILSRGDKLPCDDTEREPIKIIYQTAEDGLGDTIKPRLLAGKSSWNIAVLIPWRLYILIYNIHGGKSESPCRIIIKVR